MTFTKISRTEKLPPKQSKTKISINSKSCKSRSPIL
jgi:hypothetical protein